jgi:large subunit ribosomal protein L21
VEIITLARGNLHDLRNTKKPIYSCRPAIAHPHNTMALLARSARNALLESRSAIRPPPLRASITTVSHTLDTTNTPEPLIQSGHHISLEAKSRSQTPQPLPTNAPKPSSTKVSPHARENVVSTQVTKEIRTLLPLLHLQPAHYITAHIHGRPYLLTAGDTLRLPFRMPHIVPGDILRLNRATHIGSRDYTLKAPEPLKGNADHGKKVYYLDERLFTCRARVVGVESEPLRVEEKTKRRQRHVKHVKSKLHFTVLKVSELEVRSLEEYEAAIKQQAS